MPFTTTLSESANKILQSKIYYPDVNKLNDEEYALVRKKSFGASDVAALLGVAYKTTYAELLENKKNPELTEEERAIGKLPAVRKGKDLEPLILQKFCEFTGFKAEKPTDMYIVIEGRKDLTTNLDGITTGGRPVELKYVTTFGHKNWNTDGTGWMDPVLDKPKEGTPIKEHIMEMANHYGIPAYYYTQVQTQLMCLQEKVGYLCALFEKDWELRIYTIDADPFVQTRVSIESLKAHMRAFPHLYEDEGTGCNRDF